jgi:hypothetical protein
LLLPEAAQLYLAESAAMPSRVELLSKRVLHNDLCWHPLPKEPTSSPTPVFPKQVGSTKDADVAHMAASSRRFFVVARLLKTRYGRGIAFIFSPESLYA